MTNNKTKDKILNAANKLFIENDYENISIRDVCSLSGVSIGSFYHQIKSKENLMRIIYQSAVNRGINDASELETDSSIEKIIFLITTVIDNSKTYGYKYYKYLLKLGLDGTMDFKRPDSLYNILKGHAEEAILNKEFNNKYSSVYIAQNLMSGVRGALYEWCLMEGKMDVKMIMLSVTHCLIDKFKKKK